MNVYDRAYELAKAMKECPEAHDLKGARLAVEGDARAKLLMDDFRLRQEGFQQQMMAGEEPSPDEMADMNQLYEELSLNPLLHRLFEAERRFGIVFDDVNKIITESLKNVYE
ncbi:YlbF family regulator [Paenibacillus daejeonensis]|uniref:YlbF family regulator n=1 Tax=Paenibacillus daejeonensis TaxID=135193 RepID=UPI00035FD166|nr:YlbF family regulator [Paenibacillus daejeonensis]